MNIAENLSREIERVTLVRSAYRLVPGTNTRPAIALMDAAIEAGHNAAGSGDAQTVIEAVRALQEFNV
jgi:hypothetical protein